MNLTALLHIFSSKGRQVFVAIGAILVFVALLLAFLTSIFKQEAVVKVATRMPASRSIVGIEEQAPFVPVTTTIPLVTELTPVSNNKTEHAVVTTITTSESMVASSWLSAVQAQIVEAEYEITRLKDNADLPGVDVAYQAPNRAQNFRTYFTPGGIHLRPRTGAENAWDWGLHFVSYGYAGHLRPITATAPVTVDGNRLVYQHEGVTEWYLNDARGLEQGFTVAAPADSKKGTAEVPLILALRLTGGLAPHVSADGQVIDFYTAGGERIIAYSNLQVYDATGRHLPAWMETTGCAAPAQTAATANRSACTIHLAINDQDATYPLVIDPLASAPDWSAATTQINADFGHAAAGAGDVNGDGYADVIIGAPLYDAGFVDEGAVFMYLGGVSGLSQEPWTAVGGQGGAQFGYAVSSAGDVNGDGYDDILVGAPFYSDTLAAEGQVAVFYGSSSGLITSTIWTMAGGTANAYFGQDVAGGGDVNGDGYADILIGAPNYANGQNSEGRVSLFFGSASGVSASNPWQVESNAANASLGYAVAMAGDLNGDNYADLVVGAPRYTNGEIREGQVRVYYGSSSGPGTTADWVVESDTAYARLGSSISSAGDVNGDGWDDIVAGAPGYSNGESEEGRVYVYYGSATGITGNNPWMIESDTTGAWLGEVVGQAGDVNGDGYDDIILGMPNYNNGGQYLGRVLVYHGAAAGLGTAANWSVQSDHAGDRQGTAVSGVGDVNGDGYDDVILSAPHYNDTGRALGYLGSPSGLSSVADWTAESDQSGARLGITVSTAGDVNGDNYADVIVGASGYDTGDINAGKVFVYHGAAAGLSLTPNWMVGGDQRNAFFGAAVANAGDVNGDGYSEVIVGAPYYQNGQTKEGRAYVYFGSATGLVTGTVWMTESNLAYSYLGAAVSSAGDVNGDGYADILIGAPRYSNGQVYEGRIFVFHGASTGLNSTADWTAESNQALAYLGTSVDTAGDVNGDGYSDVVAGAPGYTNGQSGEGGIFVYLGSDSGLSSAPDWAAESDQAGARLGDAVGTAGDVNGDGYADILAGAPLYDSGIYTDGGRVVMYYGAASGLGSNNRSPDWVSMGDRADAQWGYAVSTAGDVNGDGFADVLIGAPSYSNGESAEGATLLYQGSSVGLLTATTWLVESDQAGARMGYSVSTAGDVNGDGYDDVIIGAPDYNNGQSGEGLVYLFYGAGSGAQAPEAAFSGAPRNGTVPLTVTFTNASINATSFLWDFGDGMTSTATSPVHAYSVPSIYTVTLEATGPGGTGVLQEVGYITVAPPITFTLGWAVEGDQDFARMGYAAAAAGDVNGDGYDDVLVGAYLYNNGEVNEGLVQLYYGSASGLRWTPAWSVDGNQSGAWLGLAVQAAGDVNGDGYADVIVGARNYDSGGYIDNGRVLVFYGSAAGLAAAADWIADGDQDAAYLGHAVAGAGDVNGDGYDDVIIGARGYSNGQTAEGRVYVYYGSASGLGSAPDWITESDYAGSWFGYAVAAAGDVNDDGYGDIIIGSPYDGDGVVTGGKAYVYYGSSTGLGITPWVVSSDQAGSELGIGTGVSGVGDVNGDGIDDVLVGAQSYDSGETDEGKVFLYLGTKSGLSQSPAWSLESNQAGANLGWSVGYVGDLNQDGVAELFFSADEFDTTLSNVGRVYLYAGQMPFPGEIPYWTADGMQTNGRFGHIVGTAGDVDGNGYADLLIGQPYYANGQSLEGRVLVYYTSVITPLQPVADFTAVPVSGGAPLTVTFTNNSSYATGFLWSFGDGVTSTLVNPAHTYTETGSYTVTLTAVNAYGSDARTRSQYITVTTGAHTWEQIITTHSPLVWGEYAMAYDSGRDVVALYGGNAGGWPYENSTWEFDGTDWEPVTTTNQPDAVYGMKMVYDESHNQILLFGGSDNDDTALAETWIFSGTSWLAVTISQSPPARTNHAMAYDSDAGDIYLFGGNDGLAYFNDLWRYDGSAWSQVTISGTMPPPRTLSTLVYDVPGGRLLLFGGREEAGAPLADLWEFDINTSAWTELTASGPAARYAHSMAYNPATGTVIMVGGVSDSGDVVFGDTWQFQNGGWTELEPIPLSGGVAYHTLVYDENTQAFLLVSGGATWEYR